MYISFDVTVVNVNVVVKLGKKLRSPTLRSRNNQVVKSGFKSTF